MGHSYSIAKPKTKLSMMALTQPNMFSFEGGSVAQKPNLFRYPGHGVFRRIAIIWHSSVRQPKFTEDQSLQISDDFTGSTLLVQNKDKEAARDGVDGLATKSKSKIGARRAPRTAVVWGTSLGAEVPALLGSDFMKENECINMSRSGTLEEDLLCVVVVVELKIAESPQNTKKFVLWRHFLEF